VAESLPSPTKPGTSATALVPEALSAYEQGQQLPDFATAAGIGYRTLMRAILAAAPDEWYELQSVRAEERLHKAEDELENQTSDALVISRARESARAAQWRLERLNRRRYGQDQAPNTGQVAISIHITRTEPAQAIDIKAERVDE